MMKADNASFIATLNQWAETKLNHLQDMLELTASLADALADDRDEAVERLLNLRQGIIDQIDNLDSQTAALCAECSREQLAQWQEGRDFWHQKQQQVLASIVIADEKNRLAAKTTHDLTREKMKRAKLSREVFNHYGRGAENLQTVTGWKIDQKK